MNDLLMYLCMGAVVWIMYRGVSGKNIIPFIKKTKKKKVDERGIGGAVKELEGSFADLAGIKTIRGNMIELKPVNETRTFVGAITCYPINYQLRSRLEQEETDDQYEHLLASLSLGPGREVKICIHVQSRPIELTDQLKQYHDAFGQLDPIAQRYAQSMFFPFLEQWQSTVDEYDYARFFFVILEYPPKMLEDLDEDTILAKARNEFARLSGNIISNYGRMGGIAEDCSIEALLEAMYFACNKRTGSVESLRNILNSDARLSTIVMPDYRADNMRPAYRYLEEEEEELTSNAKEAS